MFLGNWAINIAYLLSTKVSKDQQNYTSQRYPISVQVRDASLI